MASPALRDLNRLAVVGVLLAPVTGLAIGVWAEFADLGPALLLAVATPAMAVSLASASRVWRLDGRPVALVLAGVATGLLTFALAAATYIVLHLLRGGGLDLNGDDDGGSAGVFVIVHVVVGALAGLVLGVCGGVLAYAGRRMRLATHRAKS
jgi:hypothetical protein